MLDLVYGPWDLVNERIMLRSFFKKGYGNEEFINQGVLAQRDYWNTILPVLVDCINQSINPHIQIGNISR